jgi:hypothetical protein
VILVIVPLVLHQQSIAQQQQEQQQQSLSNQTIMDKEKIMKTYHLRIVK